MDPVRLLNHVTDSTATRQAPSVCMHVCVCPDVASYVGSNALLSFKFDYFREHFSISPAIMALNIFLCEKCVCVQT